MTIRVWLPAPGVVLVHRTVGFPMPPLDHDARAALDPPVPWPWKREDVRPCTGYDDATIDKPWLPWVICHRLAVWRVSDGRTCGYYCPAHVTVRPNGDPVALCTVCTGPLAPLRSMNGYTTHRACDEPQTVSGEDFDKVVALLQQHLGGVDRTPRAEQPGRPKKAAT